MRKDGAVSQTQFQEGSSISNLFFSIHGAAEHKFVILQASLHHFATLLVMFQSWLAFAYSPRIKALLL